MKPFFHRFGVRLTAAIIFSMMVVVILSGILLYQLAWQTRFEGVRASLMSISQTGAQTIKAEYIPQIPLSKEGVNTQAYAIISDQLKRIKAANPQIKYIYIMTKMEHSPLWQFVVDPDDDESGWHGVDTYPGRTYDASRFPEMLKSFDMVSADRKIESDEWGKTVSGYAPIRDTMGRPVAILGVDVDAADIYAMRSQVLTLVIMVMVVGVVLAFVVGAFVSRRVVGPVNELIAGTRYITEGNWRYQVLVRGDDEITELATSFNQMAQSLEESRLKLINYFYDTVKSMVFILEIRDHYTLGHSESVADYSEKIARRMGIDGKTLEMFKRVVLLHDIGKVGVRDSVLLKPDRLTDEEWDAIKLHPTMGEQILKPILSDPLMLAVIRNHHERQDGKGYPDGLKGDQIPLLVAITTVADSYDAMTSTRAYRRAMTKEQAVEQLKKNCGTQFDPDVVDAFLKILDEESA